MGYNASCLNNYFPTKLCLTQESRPDRWKQAEQEFNRVGIDVERFLSYAMPDPFASFCKSQWYMLDDIASGGCDGLTFEDDAIFRECDHLEIALQELPKDWDMLYLGANLLEPKLERYSRHLFRVREAWTSHAIAYTPSMAAYIVNNYNPVSGGMYDDWLKREVLNKFSCFVVAPMVCYQRPGRSDLWGRQTDYEPAFLDSDRKLV